MPNNAVQRYNQYNSQPSGWSMYGQMPQAYNPNIESFLNKAGNLVSTAVESDNPFIKFLTESIPGYSGMKRQYELAQQPGTTVKIGPISTMNFGNKDVALQTAKNIGSSAIDRALFGKYFPKGGGVSNIFGKNALKNIAKYSGLSEAGDFLLNKFIPNKYTAPTPTTTPPSSNVGYADYASMFGTSSYPGMTMGGQNVVRRSDGTYGQATDEKSIQDRTAQEAVDAITKYLGLDKSGLTSADRAALNAAKSGYNVDYQNAMNQIRFGIGSENAARAKALRDIQASATGTLQDVAGALADYGQGFSPAQYGGAQQSISTARDLETQAQNLATGNKLADYILQGQAAGATLGARLGGVTAQGQGMQAQNMADLIQAAALYYGVPIEAIQKAMPNIKRVGGI